MRKNETTTMKRADCKISTPSFSLDSYAYRSDGQEPSRYIQIQKVVERYCVYIGTRSQ